MTTPDRPAARSLPVHAVMDQFEVRDGQLCVTCEITMACVDMDKFAARDIPDDIRSLFARFKA